MKSCSDVIFVAIISGSLITTLGFPPCFKLFASKSPSVLETDNFPGNTL